MCKASLLNNTISAEPAGSCKHEPLHWKQLSRLCKLIGYNWPRSEQQLHAGEQQPHKQRKKL